jgi:hypothetical protein
MRKRNEAKANWTVRLYKYRVYLKDHFRFLELPESVQKEAQAMRDYWNTLVKASVESSSGYQDILRSHPEVEVLTEIINERKTTLLEITQAIKAVRQQSRTRKTTQEADLKLRATEVKAELRKSFDLLKLAKIQARVEKREALTMHRDEWEDYLKKMRQTAPFHWGNREFLLDTFKAALGKARKEGASLKEQQGRFTRLHFRQPYTSGIEVGKLFVHDGRVKFREHKKKRIHGSILVGDRHLEMDVAYHRPLPPDGMVKFVDLVGNEYCKGGGQIKHGAYGFKKPLWEWYVVFAVEFPPVIPVMPEDRETCAIDIGWRKVQNGLRVGLLLSTAGEQVEILLPHHLLNHYEQTISLQSDIDTETDTLKEKLLSFQVSDEARKVLTSPHLSRPKMFYLMKLLDGDALTLAQAWSHKTTRLYFRQRNLLRYCLRYRDDFYRKLALDICRKYQTVILEDLDLRVLRTKEQRNGKQGLELAEYLGRFANLSFFRRALIEASVKTQTQVQKVEAKGTTSTCHVCGLPIENTGALTLSCPNGHYADQDRNASLNMLFPKFQQDEPAHIG